MSEPRNTHENVTNVNRIARDQRWTRILLVSSPYHMRRALLVWRKVAPDLVVVPTPPEQTQFYEHYARRESRADPRDHLGVSGDVRLLASRLDLTAASGTSPAAVASNKAS